MKISLKYLKQKMQSRSFGDIARRSIRYIQSHSNECSLIRRGLATSTPYRTADPDDYAQDKEAHQPAVPHGMPQETKQKYEPETGKADLPLSTDDHTEQHNNNTHKPPIKETQPLSPPNPPFPSSPRLENTEIHNPSNPATQQKRSLHQLSTVTCSAGPEIPAETSKNEDEDEEDRKYYMSHKASPLAEIELADTRKPLTQATSTAGGYYGGERTEAVTWLPEQLDTAEEALRRAVEIWKRKAERGDPDSPHGRVLRALRGEYF